MRSARPASAFLNRLSRANGNPGASDGTLAPRPTLPRVGRKKNCCRPGRLAGFTLIEVLVALAIVGLALAAVAGVFSTGLAAHATASDAEAALALAEERLALASASPHPGAGSGTFAGRFAWQTIVSSYADPGNKDADAPNSLPLLYRVAVSVAWHDGHRSREVALSTLRLAAPPKDTQ
jgi:general secretion pathway protein I